MDKYLKELKVQAKSNGQLVKNKQLQTDQQYSYFNNNTRTF